MKKFVLPVTAALAALAGTVTAVIYSVRKIDYFHNR